MSLRKLDTAGEYTCSEEIFTVLTRVLHLSMCMGMNHLTVQLNNVKIMLQPHLILHSL